MTGSMQLIREFCDILVTPEKATRTRIVSVNNLMFVMFVMNKSSYSLLFGFTEWTVDPTFLYI